MSLAEVNILAIVAAAVASWLIGAAWYGAFGKVWMRAARLDPASIRPSPMLFVISFLAELVMAFVLASLFAHFPEMSVGEALASAGFLWLGLVATVLVVNTRYQGFGWDLPIIDGGHWLLVLLAQAAILAAWR